MRGNNRQGQIARQRRLDRALRRRSRATSTRMPVCVGSLLPPRIGEPPPEPVVMVGIPVVVGACMFGQLVAFGAVKERTGLEAFRVALSIQFPEGFDQVHRFRAQLMQLGVEQFTRVWHLLVAYVDRVGVSVARDELNRGLLYGKRLDS